MLVFTLNGQQGALYVLKFIAIELLSIPNKVFVELYIYSDFQVKNFFFSSELQALLMNQLTVKVNLPGISLTA